MPDASPSLPDAEPIVFDGLFGWLTPGTGRRGVVLCGATGFEQLSAHRAWRDLADRLGATGCTTLRFDYPGEGDSTDDGAGTLAAWLGAIRSAVRFLRDEAGVEEVVLVGLRLGGTLAALAAGEAGADRLVLLSPFRTGQAYMREMRLRAQAVNVRSDGTVPTDEPGHLTVGGFRIGPDLAAELAAIDIAAVPAAPAPRILLLGADATLAARFAGLGAEVERGPLAGLALLVGNPLFAVAPEEAFARVVAYAGEGTGKGAEPCSAVRPVSAPARLAGDGWSEEAARFGPGLFGIHASPSVPVAGAPTILLLGAGLSAHSGWGRQGTRRARAFAASGFASLRLDLRGIGDAAERPGGTFPLFAHDVADDLRHAVDHLAARSSGPIVLVGTCSGAYAAFHAACRDTRIAAALLVNPPCFDRGADDVHAMIRASFGSTATYAGKLRDGRTWRRILRGEIHIRAIGAALAARGWRAARKRLHDLIRPPPGGSLSRRLAALTRRGARLRLVYAAGDPGLEVLRARIGRTPARVVRRIGAPAAIVPATDHNLGTVEAQAELDALLHRLLAELEAPRAQRAMPHAAPQRAALLSGAVLAIRSIVVRISTGIIPFMAMGT